MPWRTAACPDQQRRCHLPNKTLTIKQVLALLAQTPPRIATLTAGLAPAQLQTSPKPGEWSVNEVLAHLRACADVWGNCIVAILSQDRPALRAVNPPYLDQKYGLPRAGISALVASLYDAADPATGSIGTVGTRRLVTYGDHNRAGKVLERSVLFYGRWLASHERPHLKQIEHIVNTMRR